MTKEEFKKFVLSEAKKILGDSEGTKASCEAFSSSDVKELSENIKRLKKDLDFRNPMLSEQIIKSDDSSDRMRKLYSFQIPDDENR